MAARADELLARAGYVLTERSRAKPGDYRRYELECGRLTGFVDVYDANGVARFWWLVFQHRERPPSRRGWERADAAIWIMEDDYMGAADIVAEQIDHDCREVLVALATGRILAGEQAGRFTMLVPERGGYRRTPAGQASPALVLPLAEHDTTGLVDIRQLAHEPYPSQPPRRGWRRRLGI